MYVVRVPWLQTVVVMIAGASAALVPRLGENAPFYLVFPPGFICIGFGLILVWKNDGMRRSQGLVEHLIFGFYRANWSNMDKPIALSFSGYVIILSAAAMVGAILRMFWAMYV